MDLFYEYLPAELSKQSPGKNLATLVCNKIVFLHGFLGSGTNLKLFARKFTKIGYNVFLPDLRNHGQSPHSEEISYSIMASDIYQMLETRGIDKVILCGHSMGGKTAIQFTVNYPEKVKKLIILDMTPSHRDIKEAHKIIKILSQINLQDYKSREEVKHEVLPHLNHPLLVDFLLKNLIIFPKMKWRCNMKILKEKINFLGKKIDLISKVDINTLFVGGENSVYISDADKKKIFENFSKVNIKMIPNSGHWLHYEQPEYLFKVLTYFIINKKH